MSEPIRPTRPKPRTFDHFPEKCVLVGIDGSEDGHNQQAQPVHLYCCAPTNFSREMWLLYTRVAPQS